MRGFSRALAAAAISMGVAVTTGGVAQAVPVQRAEAGKKQRRKESISALMFSEALIGTRHSRRTVAMDKREAKKSRNVKRHRAASRG